MTEAKPPILECDLVMKGGIASGLVYPIAVAELSRRYRFRRIAGTSAGAIAAAVSAAAEYGRQRGVTCRYDGRELTPFERVAALPTELAGGKHATKLSKLFQPQPDTARFFKVALKALSSGPRSIAFSLIKICSRGVALVMLASLLFGFAIGGAPGVMLAVAIAVPGAIVSVALSLRRLVRDVEHAVPENFYGLCTGRTVAGHGSSGLTDWLHELLQSLAGRSIDDRPLTMGDLWLLSEYDPQQWEPLINRERAIDLQFMTSNITQGRSHRFPNLIDWSGSIYFKKEEFDRLFPKAVVDWMVDRGLLGNLPGEELQLAVPQGYYHLPSPEHLPVLFGARISLSFPFLLSAVPLYVFDLSVLKDIWQCQPPFETPPEYAAYVEKWVGGYSDPVEEARWGEWWEEQFKRVPLKRCWFSDGGITSNFPIHFFDGPLARRPTFGINLTTPTTKIDTLPTDTAGVPPKKGYSTSKANTDTGWGYIFMTTTNEEVAARIFRFNSFETSGSRLLGFFSALFDTSRNWADNEQTFMPSYCDRIVHVMLEPHEGGLNLNMPPDVIQNIARRGQLAAEMLLARFGSDPEARDPKSGWPVVLTWNNHRWVRYRTFMAALEDLLSEFAHAWREERDHPERLPPGTVALPELIRQAGRAAEATETSAIKDYWWRTTEQMQHAQAVSDAIARMVAGWTSPDQSFDAKAPAGHFRPPSTILGRAPRPKPKLRVVPSYELVEGWEDQPTATDEARSSTNT